ncbi:D-isomer specific 2-hydroxyacid dehydrogenase NAD-binding protein [uncultured Eubacteriales bacterium]|uniref:D-isomer specific 2-hydroxyacid dehydrogenase NAD-binding protein n=1 Tax=uncultured Eubacteriales bacterium TaxID=172733 RepID=A0A212KH82_9FIRM|nr:D-isomer specific 2-hydroxyacid dehydrogenase NAD-binding protein [uncultured Eubacteriales bacterium]
MMNKIVISHPLYKDGMALLEGKAELIIPNNGNSDEIMAQLQDADAFILRIGKIDRKAIEACENLKVITRPGVGYDNVDVDAATERGIPVVLCPSANARAVAEHTISMMFALSKNTVESVVETKKGNFNIRNKYAAVDILDKTMVVLGFGNIGKTVAQMSAALGMKVGVYDPFVKREDAEALGYSYFEDMLDAIAAGDYVSLHMPSMPSTRKMFSERQFAAMKPTAYLLNAARGDIVDEDAMVRCLEAGEIAGAGLDVLVEEPMPAGHPLMGLDNVVLTPHMAAQTQETVSKLATMAAEGTLAVLRGEKWPHVANAECYHHPRWQGK